MKGCEEEGLGGHGARHGDDALEAQWINKNLAKKYRRAPKLDAALGAP